jgi:hypothetical protein
MALAKLSPPAGLWLRVTSLSLEEVQAADPRGPCGFGAEVAASGLSISSQRKERKVCTSTTLWPTLGLHLLVGDGPGPLSPQVPLHP